MKAERIPGLDLLRASAILLVVLSHLPLTWGDPQTMAVWTRNMGPLGVDLFFALSGFLIGGILLDTGGELRQPRIVGGFWLNRWLRTLPNFYLMFAVSAGLWVWIFARRQTPWGDFARTALFSHNLTHIRSSFYLETWSLSVEEWFYLLLPLGLWLGLRLGFRFRTVLAGLLVIMFVEPLLHRAMVPVRESWLYEINFIVLNKFDALGCGVAAAWVLRAQPRWWDRYAGPLALLGGAIVVFCYAFSQTTHFDQYWFSRVLFPLLQPLGCALLLPVSCRWRGWNTPVLTAATAALARWSYSLYLINSHIEYLVRWAGRSWGVTQGWRIVIGDAVFLASSIAIAAFVYRWYEAPFLRLRGRVAWCRAATEAQRRTPVPNPRSGDRQRSGVPPCLP